MNGHNNDHTDEQTIEEVSGVDDADVNEALRHVPDDTMERAGTSPHTRDELDLPPDSDDEPPPDE